MGNEMTANEVVRLITWLKNEGMDSDKIVDCIETIEGKENDSKTE